MTQQTKTLGDYRDLFALIGGEQSRAVKFLDGKIAEQGRDMEVVAAESQMLTALFAMDAADDE